MNPNKIDYSLAGDESTRSKLASLPEASINYFLNKAFAGIFHDKN